MSYSYEENELLECCAVDCVDPGTEFLVIKSWSNNRYGGKDQQDRHRLVTSGYYCENHMAEKLESLTRRYRPSSSTKTTTTTTADMNLAATSPKK
jgi:hypothetical protein